MNDLGFKPFAPLVEHLIDVFAPFDVQPAPDADSVEMQADWSGAYDEGYIMPIELAERAALVDGIRRMRTFGRPEGDGPEYELAALTGDEESVNKDRVQKLTKTLAYLHSRGEVTLEWTLALTYRRRRAFRLQCRGRRWRRGFAGPVTLVLPNSGWSTLQGVLRREAYP